MQLQFLNALSAALLLVCVTTAPTHARQYECEVTDAVGDPTRSPGLGFDGEAYQDIVKTSITRTAGAVTFSMELAAPIPAAPPLRTPNGLLLWMWGMQTAPEVPSGFPLSPGLTGLLEFWIHLAWNGQEFFAQVIDRRPGAQGGVPVVTTVPFVVDGRRIYVIASPSLFDDPASFRWGSSTWFWSTHLGTAAAHVVDRAPEGASTCAAQ